MAGITQNPDEMGIFPVKMPILYHGNPSLSHDPRLLAVWFLCSHVLLKMQTSSLERYHQSRRLLCIGKHYKLAIRPVHPPTAPPLYMPGTGTKSTGHVHPPAVTVPQMHVQ